MKYHTIDHSALFLGTNNLRINDILIKFALEIVCHIVFGNPIYHI